MMTNGSCEPESEVVIQLKGIYNETVVDHAVNPRNFGEIQGVDGFAKITSPHGDTMKIWIKVSDNKIQQVSFWTDSCGASVACFSMATEMVKGKTVNEAARLQPQDILRNLGGLPEGNEHCAALAAGTLKAAVQDFFTLRREPWKKAYRRL